MKVGVNEAALLAEILVRPDCVDLWKQIRTGVPSSMVPALLDAGATTRSDGLWEQMLQLINEIKSDIFNNFVEDYVSDETTKEDPFYDAWTSIRNIDPSKAVFSSIKDLMQLDTSMTNLHDALRSRLSASGYSDVGLARRIRCWAGPPAGGYGYLGEPGKAKNIGLFYYWLVMQRGSDIACLSTGPTRID